MRAYEEFVSFTCNVHERPGPRFPAIVEKRPNPEGAGNDSSVRVGMSGYIWIRQIHTALHTHSLREVMWVRDACSMVSRPVLASLGLATAAF